MASVKLDTTGLNKMKALDDAAIHLQRIHGLVEQYAMAVKRNQPTAAFIFKAMASTRSEFSGMSYDVLGAKGKVIAGEMAGATA